MFVVSYYVNGRDASLEDFLDPKVLDMLAVKTDEILKVTRLSLSWLLSCTRTFNAVKSDKAVIHNEYRHQTTTSIDGHFYHT